MKAGIKLKLDKNKLNKAIENETKAALNRRTYDITCPFCKSKINVPTGKSLCPVCKKEIDLSLNIHF